jgi:hypothetical protein
MSNQHPSERWYILHHYMVFAHAFEKNLFLFLFSNHRRYAGLLVSGDDIGSPLYSLRPAFRGYLSSGRV